MSQIRFEEEHESENPRPGRDSIRDFVALALGMEVAHALGFPPRPRRSSRPRLKERGREVEMDQVRAVRVPGKVHEPVPGLSVDEIFDLDGKRGIPSSRSGALVPRQVHVRALARHRVGELRVSGEDLEEMDLFQVREP